MSLHNLYKDDRTRKRGTLMKKKQMQMLVFFILMMVLSVYLIYRGVSSSENEKSRKETGSQGDEALEEAESQDEAALKITGEQTEEGAEFVPSAEESENLEEEAAAKVVQYPVLAVIDSETWIDAVIVSEGIYCIYNGEKYGFVTENGESIAPFIYDVAYPFHEGLACVCAEGKYGYIDPSGELAIPMIYDRAAPFMEGLAYFATEDTYGFMDKTGTQVFEFECDSVSSFQEGLAYFSKDGQYGYIDQNGQIVIEAAYDDAEYFQDGLARVMKNGKYGVIGRDGSYILEPEYDDVKVDASFIITQRDGRYGCFDTAGRRLLDESYDYLSIEKGYILIRNNEKYGLADVSGTILFEPVYDLLSPVPGREFVLAKKDGVFGIVNLKGETLLPFEYPGMYYTSYRDNTDGGMIIVRDEEEKEGSLDAADLSWVFPCIYDSIEWYGEDRAVVGIDEKYGRYRKYGVADREGNLIVPIEYLKVGFFQDGTIYVKEKQKRWVVLRGDETVELGTYDSITKKGNCYLVERDGKYGYLNEFGEMVLSPIYSHFGWYGIHGASGIYIGKIYGSETVIVKTGESERVDVSEILLQNEITPRLGLYWEFVKDSFISAVGWDGGISVYQEELNGCRRTYKLYDVNHTGKPILYFYAEPYEGYLNRSSYSVFCEIINGQLIQLISGYEGGGTGGGDYVCLWYDRMNGTVTLGKYGHWGGFMGYAYGGEVYDHRNGENELMTSFRYTNQYTGNYRDEELLERAELFYYGENNEEDIPFTRETILEAGAVTEYTVDGEQCTVETYRETVERYRKLYFLN